MFFLGYDWLKDFALAEEYKSGQLILFQKFPEAEEAFLQVLKLDKNCDEAVQELQQVRTRQLTVRLLFADILKYYVGCNEVRQLHVPTTKHASAC